MQIDRRRLLTTATCAVLTGVACAPVARPVEPNGPAVGRFHPLTHSLLDRARRAGMGLGTEETRSIERIIHELALSACCDQMVGEPRGGR
jgi:hypothetical protein